MRELHTVYNPSGFPGYTVGWDDKAGAERAPTAHTCVHVLPVLDFWERIQRGWLALWEDFA